MSRTILPMPPPNTIDVIGSNSKALGDLICYSLVDIYTSDEYEALMTKIAPSGPGFQVGGIVGTYWIDTPEDSIFIYDPELPIPDYANLDIWAVSQSSAHSNNQLEIEGSELRRLFHEAYQIYVQRGLIRDS